MASDNADGFTRVVEAQIATHARDARDSVTQARAQGALCVAVLVASIVFAETWAPAAGLGAVLAWTGQLLLASAAWLTWMATASVRDGQLASGSAARWIHEEWARPAGGDPDGMLHKRLQHRSADGGLTDSDEARGLLTEWLGRQISTDVTAWLPEPSESVPADQVVERADLVLRLWAARRQAATRADLLRLGTSWASASGVVLVLAAIWSATWMQFLGALVLTGAILGWRISAHASG